MNVFGICVLLHYVIIFCDALDLEWQTLCLKAHYNNSNNKENMSGWFSTNLTNFSSLPSARRPEGSRPALWDSGCRQPSFPPLRAPSSRRSQARSPSQHCCWPSLTWWASAVPGSSPPLLPSHSAPHFWLVYYCWAWRWGSPRSQTQSPRHSRWWTSWSSGQSRHCWTTGTQGGSSARRSSTMEWPLPLHHQGSPRFQYQSLLSLHFHLLHLLLLHSNYPGLSWEEPSDCQIPLHYRALSVPSLQVAQPPVSHLHHATLHLHLLHLQTLAWSAGVVAETVAWCSTPGLAGYSWA